MRVLVTCVPQTGHIVPLLPLAEAFSAAGAEVLWASGEDAAAPVTARGLTFRTAGPSFGEWYGALVGRTRGAPGDGLAPDKVERYFLPRLFGEVGTALMLDDLLEVARDFQPQLVVFDPLTYAGPLVAALSGARGVVHTVGPFTDRTVTDLVADAVSPIWRQQGLDVPEHAGIYAGTVVTICPPSLDPAIAMTPGARTMRPTSLPVPAAAPPPDLPAGLWERPVVYLTLGTFSNNPSVFSLLLEALGDVPVNVVATIGRDNDPASLGSVPPNAHVAQFIPQHELLPRCAAAVHHAGAGTAFGILAHKLPSVAVPQGADNFAIAQRLHDAGAARTLMPGDATRDAVRDATVRVLDDAVHRQAAHRLGDEIAAMPSPDEVAAELLASVTQ